jgi:DNA-binding response OmpR family regulator
VGIGQQVQHLSDRGSREHAGGEGAGGLDLRRVQFVDASPTLQGGVISNLLGKAADPRAMFDRPIVDTVAMTITWRGLRCPLGYTRLLDLIERLVRSPGRWVPHERLLREVWDDDMLCDSAIKVAVTRLKAKLTAHGMPIWRR